MRLSRRVPLHRFVLGLVTIAAWCAAAIFVARTYGSAAAIAAGVLFTVPLTSLGEWLVHGLLYHGHIPGLAFIRTIHHHGHHFALFPPERYVQSGDYEFMRFRKPVTPFAMADNAWDNFVTAWSQVALHFVVGVPLILVPAWLASRNLAFVASCLGTLAVISWLLAYVHGVIHSPRDRWIERRAWFQWLDHHHYIHHIDLSANINFMLPICDFLFGTQKFALTDKEAASHLPFAEARRSPRAPSRGVDVVAPLARPAADAAE